LIVFTHGAQVDHGMFKSQIPAFVRRYRVLTWDIRGHGLSCPLRGTLSYRSAADDIIALLDHLACERAILIGHSMGGCIVQEAAFCYPDRVKAMALIGSLCVTIEPLKPMLLFARMLLVAGQLLPQQALSRLIVQLTRGHSIDPDVQAYICEATKQISRDAFIAIYQALVEGFHDEPAYRAPWPFLLAYGERDMAPMLEHARVWAERDSNCRYVVVPEAGHNANQDNPVVFNNLLDEFLQGRL
jgi:pimeloyl-ACP methyl ester carboxylesterase